MNVKELKRRYANRLAALQREHERLEGQIFAEICGEYGWPVDASVFVEHGRQDGKYWERFSITWVKDDGSVEFKSIAKSLGKLLLEMGFPSGS